MICRARFGQLRIRAILQYITFPPFLRFKTRKSVDHEQVHFKKREKKNSFQPVHSDLIFTAYSNQIKNHSVIFIWVSEVYLDCFGCALLCMLPRSRQTADSENSRHSTRQTSSSFYLILIWNQSLLGPQLLFLRSSGSYLVFTLNSHDLLVRTFFFVLIGCCDKFGFGLTTLNRKALILALFCLTNVRRRHCWYHLCFRRASISSLLSSYRGRVEPLFQTWFWF